LYLKAVWPYTGDVIKTNQPTKKENMTIKEKAQEIANNLTQDAFGAFVEATGERSVVEYIALFSQFGIAQNVVWDLYEEWQVS
jgi:hypothetical protein